MCSPQEDIDALSVQNKISEHKKTKIKTMTGKQTGEFYERSFITFENDKLFSKAFKTKPQPRPTLIPLCAITR